VESLVEAGRRRSATSSSRRRSSCGGARSLIDPENERIQAYIARAERQLETLEQLRAERDGGA
jgi:hypothetical protein